MNNNVFLLLPFCLLALHLQGQSLADHAGQIHYSISFLGDVDELIDGHLPTSFDIFFRKDDVRIHVNNPVLDEVPDQLLYIAKKKKFYQLRPTAQTALALSVPMLSRREFTPTGESKILLDYPCDAYNASWEENGIQVAQQIWVAPIAMPIGIKSFQLPIIENFGQSDLSGLPLLIETTLTRGDLTQEIRVEAETMEAKPRERGFFKIPKTYRILD